MLIAEIFSSFQGEGRLTGTPSIFVRVGACNLRCRFCDTPYASWSPEGEDLSVDEIFERVQNCQESIGRVRNSAIMETELCPIAPQPRQLENC
ncbi:MAG: radical SAM protein, partial [Thermoguttaceae bacterium]